MQERFSHFLAADSEEEMEGWVITLKHALQSSTEGGDRKNGGDHLDCALGEEGGDWTGHTHILIIHIHTDIHAVYAVLSYSYTLALQTDMYLATPLLSLFS